MASERLSDEQLREWLKRADDAGRLATELLALRAQRDATNTLLRQIAQFDDLRDIILAWPDLRARITEHLESRT
jgi:hypothetical protein